MLAQPPTEFDYDALDAESRIVVRQKTDEIRDRVRRAATDIFAIGERLLSVKGQLAHGQFGRWLKLEFEWSESAAQKMMAVASQFKSVNFTDLKIAPSALYLLASDSVPEEVRTNLLKEARSGKPITHAAVKDQIDRRNAEVASNGKPSPLGDDYESVDPKEQSRRLDAIDPLLAKHRERQEKESSVAVADDDEDLSTGTRFTVPENPPKWAMNITLKKCIDQLDRFCSMPNYQLSVIELKRITDQLKSVLQQIL